MGIDRLHQYSCSIFFVDLNTTALERSILRLSGSLTAHFLAAYGQIASLASIVSGDGVDL